MSNRENFAKLLREYEGKSYRAERKAEELEKRLYLELPELKKIDTELRLTGQRLFAAAASAPAEVEALIAEIRKENLRLQERRAGCLLENGYPADYTEVKYDCPKCRDTGFCDGAPCVCFKRALALLGYESSGIGSLMKTQSFESFSFDYYKNDQKALENIKTVYKKCKKYAESFTDKARLNLLLFGGTGLGKTHLTTAMAKVIIDNGYDVVYDTAQNIMTDFERNRFTREEDGASPCDRYYNCDLLIIDDLGTELQNQFNVTCLYNIINTRINREKSTLITTNLAQAELQRRYADRIVSRILGEFEPLVFLGKDIRLMKLAKRGSTEHE